MSDVDESFACLESESRCLEEEEGQITSTLVIDDECWTSIRSMKQEDQYLLRGRAGPNIETRTTRIWGKQLSIIRCRIS